MIKRAVLAALIAVTATPVSAAELRCTISRVGGHLVGRIAEQISVEFDRATGVALVRDGFMTENGGFHYGSIARENSKILAIVWKQPAITMDKTLDPIPAPLRLSFRKGDGVMLITGSIQMTSSGVQTFSAAGVCRMS